MTGGDLGRSQLDFYLIEMECNTCLSVFTENYF
jgi:hypothetical protein